MSTNIFAKTIFLQRTLEAQIMTKVRALVYHRLYDSAYGFLHSRLSQKISNPVNSKISANFLVG